MYGREERDRDHDDPSLGVIGEGDHKDPLLDFDCITNLGKPLPQLIHLSLPLLGLHKGN
jgi:hypothetical protein